jgi:hypothetical protein
MEEIRVYRAGRATVLTPESGPIRDGAAARPVLPARPSEPGYICPYGNQQQNSRVPFALPSGSWEVQWRAEWEPAVRPVFVFQEDDRILVRGEEWRLLDANGRVVFSGAGGGGSVVLDSPHGLFYRMTSNGDLSAVRLSDGKPRFQHQPSRGDVFTRPLIARRGDRILIGGNERMLDPTGIKLPAESTLEILDVPEPVETSGLGTLTSGTVAGMLQLPSPKVQFAAGADTIVAAAPGRIWIVDWDLNIRKTLEGDFNPLALTLDEAGRLYIVTRKNDRLALWLLTPEGDRLFAFELPSGTPDLTVPPVVGYDHRVYLIAGRQILAVGADGRLEWTKPATAAVGGAVVTASGELLLTEGDSIASWDAQGQRTVLFSSGGDAFKTPPILTVNGRLLAASATRLYNLRTGGSR